jgi:hypothetical protein
VTWVLSAIAWFRQQSSERMGGDVCKLLVPVLAKWQALRPATCRTLLGTSFGMTPFPRICCSLGCAR